MNPKPTILIVEDETLILLALVDMFQQAGFRVLDASDARSAFELIDIHSRKIDVLLTDIRLGFGPDGWDIARHARSEREDMPIVFVSGDSEADFERNGFERSVMLTKPVQDREMLRAVMQGLDPER